MVLTYPDGNNVLLKGSPVCPDRKLAQEIVDLLYAEVELMVSSGTPRESILGLAAPQIGINSQVFLARMGQELEPFVNPRVRHHGNVLEEREACFSLPGYSAPVVRRGSVVIEYMTLKPWTGVAKQLTGLEARIIQHETAHLNGQLINGARPEADTTPGLQSPGSRVQRYYTDDGMSMEMSG